MRSLCLDCLQVCKQLDDDDHPVHYHFYHLPLHRLMDLLQAFLSTYKGKHWRVKSKALSLGNQLAVLMECPQYSGSDGVLEQCLIFVAEAGPDEDSCLHDHKNYCSHLWIRYGTPLNFCHTQVLMSDINDVVIAALSFLIENDVA